MTEQINYDEERFWDKVTRKSPRHLEIMDMVSEGRLPPQPTDEQLRYQKLLREDPKGFHNQRHGLEVLYQKQLALANARDRRLVEQQQVIEGLKEEIERLQEEVARANTRVTPGGVDPTETKIVDTIDRLRERWRMERESEGNQA